MQSRHSFVAAVAVAAMLSALLLSAAPARTGTCADIGVRNVNSGQGLSMIAACGTDSFDNAQIVATMVFALCARPAAGSR